MELTRSEKLQNLKTYMKRLTKTLSIFNIKESQEEFRKQLHHLHHQAKKMRRQYPLLATPLKFILSSSLKVDKFNTMAREVLLRRLYVVTREMNETLHLHRNKDRNEKLWDLHHYCRTDMPIAQKEYLQIVSIALTLEG
jgi:thermostable 8-oxoguanine DNA glycosylase